METILCFTVELCRVIKEKITSALQVLNNTSSAQLDHEQILSQLTSFLESYAAEQVYTQWIINKLIVQRHKFVQHDASFTIENISSLIAEVNAKLPLFKAKNSLIDLKRKIIESLAPTTEAEASCYETEEDFLSAEENEEAYASKIKIDEALQTIIAALEALVASAIIDEPQEASQPPAPSLSP